MWKLFHSHSGIPLPPLQLMDISHKKIPSTMRIGAYIPIFLEVI